MEEAPVYSHPLYKTSRYVWTFGAPLVLLLGNFGNVMTIIIMKRHKSDEAVINIYFTALAFLDLVILDVFLLDEWAGITFGFYIKHQNNAVCKIYNWIKTASTTIGGWFLVSLTFHRAVCVVWPHRVSSLCTRRTVASAVLGTMVFHACVYSHYLYGYNLRYVNGTSDYRCIVLLGSYLMFVDTIFTYVDLVLYSLLPFTCIIFANCVLVWKLRATVQEIRQKCAERGSVVAREKAANSVTWTVILVSVAYVVLTLPAAVDYIAVFVFDPSVAVSVAERVKVFFVRAVTHMLMYCNSAVNFYIYCLTGEKFRKEFVKIFCRK
ncbi:FMRFamide peptide receptor frpr-18-like [Babylonia areolata]|uniref:FMRFamide peptide receptor frpr-18-like n=1 Tax=Babylonia areolata TaxID=304850 RepID=UPI003FD5E6BD